VLLLLACGTPLAPPDTGTPPDLDLDAGPGDFLYTTDAILAFDLEIDDEALVALDTAPRDDAHATFGFREESYEVALHLKGSESGSFRPLSGKPSFKIDFHEWDPDATFHGVRRLTLNNMVQDPSMSAEHAAYRLLSELDVPGPRHGYATVTLNGEAHGLFGIVETMDEQFVNRTWPDDDGGDLLEGGYGADVGVGLATLFDVKEDGDTADATEQLDEMIAAFAAATDDDAFLTFFETWFDADEALRDWAWELAIADEDGYTTLANNFLLYRAPVEGRWHFVGWGPDQSMVTDLDVHTPLVGALAARCGAVPTCRAELDDAVAEVLGVWEEIDLASFVDTETRRIEEDCRQDPRSEWGDYGCRDAQEALRAWVAARPGEVL
jgi:hypothetical protein